MNAARKIKGRAAKNATAASFQPNEKETATQPITVKIETSGKTPLGPKSSWSCLRSLDNRPIRLPDALLPSSKKGIGCRRMLPK
jgi:hypothetical protein